MRADTGQCGHGGIDLVEAAQADIGGRWQIGRRGRLQRRRFKYNMGAVPEHLKGQEKFVLIRPLFECDDGSQVRQFLSGPRCVEGRGDDGIQVPVGLPHAGLLAIDADAHARNRNIMAV